MPFKKKIRGKESRFYYVDFWVREGKSDPHAVHINRSTRTANYDEACVIEDQWMGEAEETYKRRTGDLVSGEDLTINDALDWMMRKRWGNLKSHQQVTACIELIGDLPLAELSGDNGAGVLETLQEKLRNSTAEGGRERQPQTVDQYMSTMKTLLRKAPTGLKLKDFIMPQVPLYGIVVNRKRMLQDGEEQRMFDCIKEPLFHDLVRVLLDTGLRVTEALSLDYRSHIDVRRGQLIGIKTLKKRKEAAYRTLPMTRRVLEIFKRRRDGDPKPFACWMNQNVSQKFKVIRIKMGLADDKEFVPHMLRHTCATRLLVKGMGLVEVSNWLGHSTVAQTERYLQLSSHHIHHGANLLDEYDEELKRSDELPALQSISKVPQKTLQNVSEKAPVPPSSLIQPIGGTRDARIN